MLTANTIESELMVSKGIAEITAKGDGPRAAVTKHIIHITLTQA